MLEHKPNSDEFKLIEAPAPEKISKENLPEIVKDQVSNITMLDEQIQKALAKAGSARDAAQTAYSKSAGLFHKKNAIESLQIAVKDIGNATADNAESQKLLFDCLQKMAEVEKTVLSISCMSIAMNRSTVRELELKLKGASKEKLSELAKKELQSVIKQIRQQQDILEKQDRIEENVKKVHEETESQKKRLDKKDDLDSIQSANIAEIKRRLDEKDIIGAEQSKRLEELAALFNTKTIIDQKQDENISKNADGIAEQSKRLEELAALFNTKTIIDQKQDENISKNADGIKVLVVYTKQEIEKIKEYTKQEIEKMKKLSPKKLSIAAIIISSFALISSIASIILKLVM